MPGIRFIDTYCLLPVSAVGLNRRGLDYVVSAPIIEHGIYDIVLGTCGPARAILAR